MALTRTDENELLTALYGGLCEPMPWRLFLNRLRARMEADDCYLFLRPQGESEWRLADGVRGRLADETAMVRPDVALFDTLRPGRVYAQEDITPEAGGHARYVRVAWPESGDLVLSIQSRTVALGASDSSLLASLSPHLAIALRGRQALDAEQRRSAITGALLNGGFDEGWLLLDARGRILEADREATRLLGEGRIARRAGDGRLRLPDPTADALLQDVLARPDPPDEPVACWLSLDPLVQMLLCRSPDAETDSLASAHCLVVVRPMLLRPSVDGTMLMALFGLTRSEATLAARIAAGDSLAAAAEAMSLTIETARNYSKRIFAKTGVGGQAELVRLILEGARPPGKIG